MSAKRKLIRCEVAALLKGATAAGDDVEASRVAPPDRNELAVIGVYTLEDPARVLNTAPREYWHELELAVEILARRTNGREVSDVLDDLAEQVFCLVEQEFPRLVRDHGLNHTKSFYTGDTLALDISGSRPEGLCRMVWHLEYNREAPRKGGDLSPFRGVDVEWDFPPPDAVLEATDAIELDQT